MDVSSSDPREPRTIPLWLHRAHGTQVAELQPLQPNLTGLHQSAAQAFAAEASAVPAGLRVDLLTGLPCRVQGMQLSVDVDNSGQQESFVVLPLFLAEVSCAPFPVPGSPDMLIIALVPPVSGQGLRGTAAAGQSMAGTPAWFLLTQRGDFYNRLLDAFSSVGCLRGDFDQAFLPSPDGDGTIGDGAYATVERMLRRDGTAVAVKRMNANVELEAIEREVFTLLHVNALPDWQYPTPEVQGHDHIIGMRGLFWHFVANEARVSVAFDVAPCGDLLCKVLRDGSLSESAAQPLLQGVLRGLQQIHSCSIVHRDIKTENVLLKRPDCAVVADFGLATWITNEVQMARRCGSPGYVAPEVCLGTPYDFKVDIFGAGIILYFVLSREMPFSSPDRDTATTMRRTVRCNLHLHKKPWDAMSSRLRNILRQMITKTAQERLGAAELLEHAWMVANLDRRSGTTGRSKALEEAPQPGAEAWAVAPGADAQAVPPQAPGYPHAPEVHGTPWPPGYVAGPAPERGPSRLPEQGYGFR